MSDCGYVAIIKDKITKLQRIEGAKAFSALLDTPFTYNGQGGKILAVKSTEDGVEFITGGGVTDENVKVSSTDTTAGKLNDKLVAGSNINLVVGNVGGNETLTIESTASGGGVDSVFGRTGSVVAVSGDYSASQVTNAFDKSVDTMDSVLDGTVYVKTQNDFDDTLLNKLNGIEAGAQVNTVISVNSNTGAVILDTSDISENGNLYFTDERAQDAVGGILLDTSTIDLVYDDNLGSISANVIQSGISHTNLQDIGTNTHAQIDNHISNVSNPHSVTKTQVGLGNVTDDAQLKRSANDFNSFTLKGAPTGSDYLLIEDSADSGNKKYISIGTLPTAGGGEANTASNVGTAGVGVFKQKTGIDLEFKKINSGSNKVSVTDDTGDSEVDIDIVPANINTSELNNDAGFITSYPVDSVNGQVGVVVLDADDISDTTTVNKFVTASDLTNLSNLSGTNTGDQTTIVGITGTKTQYDTSLTDGDFVFVGDNITSLNNNAGFIDSTGVTYENLNTNGDVGVVAGTVAAGDDSRFLTTIEKTDLTDGDDSTLHYHSSDRDRANHTGTQLSNTISDFQSSVSSNTDVANNTAKVGVTTQISNVVEDTTPQLGGNLDMNNNGFTRQLTAASGNSFVAGEIGYFSSTGVVKADASAEATAKGLLVMAAESVSATTIGSFYVIGSFITTGLTAGAEYYLSETAGAFTSTAPVTSGAIVRIVGYAISTTELIFQPDGTYVENA